jgi:disulfide bond formation protein DsbB
MGGVWHYLSIMCFSKCIDRLNLRLVVILAGLAAALMFSVALIGQYGFDLYPCELCIYQRYPYAALAALGVAAFFIRNIAWLKAMAWLGVLLFAVDAGIAFYHSGVELGWFEGLSGCSNDPSQDLTLEQMRAAIMNAPLVTCDQAMIEVMGLSMAAWNGIAAAFMTLAMAIVLIKINRKARV